MCLLFWLSEPIVSGCPDPIVITTEGDSATVTWTEPTATASVPGGFIIGFDTTVNNMGVQDPSLSSGSTFSESLSPYNVVYYWVDLVSGDSAICMFTVTIDMQAGTLILFSCTIRFAEYQAFD